MRPRLLLIGLALAAGLAACGGGTTLLRPGNAHTVTVRSISGNQHAAAQLGFPAVATKNTTRIAGADPAADAAAVALAVFPSAAAGTHPTAVVLAPSSDWQAALAASVLMAPPIRAPLLLSGPSTLPTASSDALTALAPTGAGPVGGAQVIRVGDVARPGVRRVASIKGGDPFTLAGAIDSFVSAAAGRSSPDVMIASADAPAYAMPAAGLAAESGDPILYVTANTIPAATRLALLSHQSPHIYVVGPPSVVSESVVHALKRYGKVKRVGGPDPAANSVAFAEYRDPACVYGQACAHVPGSFGWAIRSPGHGYVLLNSSQPLTAAAAAPLSASGSYGPALVTGSATSLPKPVLDYFLNYATPGYTQEGPTAAVYNHGWVIGGLGQISVGVQAELDNLLEAVAQTNH